jgi:hypothetical protein
MTSITSTETTTISPCPVPWCDEAGQHLYADERTGPGVEFNEHTRFCRQETGPVDVTDPDDPIELAPVQIAAEVYEDPDGRVIGPYVDVADLNYVGSAEELAQVVRALQDAGRIAFGTDRAHREAEKEWSSALGEVLDRASRPEDTNRLVAATIRLRKAQEALGAARSTGTP